MSPSQNIAYYIYFRHGPKNGDALTEDGKTYMESQCQGVQARFGKPVRIAHSPMNRTAQCAKIAQDVTGVTAVEIDPNLWVGPAVDASSDLAGDLANFPALLSAINEAGGTVADALRIGSDDGYVHLAREQCQGVIVKMVSGLKAGESAWGMGHAPMAELGTSDPETTPFFPPEATAVVYGVNLDTDEVISTELIFYVAA